MDMMSGHLGGAAALDARGWKPSKFVWRGGRWRASRRTVNVASRLMADLALDNYEAAIRAHARGVLADLGCGNAPLAGLYAPLVDRFLWVDWPGSAHQRITLDLAQDLNQPLDLADASIDTVLLTDVLEHIARPDMLLAEVARVLRPGGHAIAGVPFLYWLHEEPHDHHRYTIHRLRDFAASHGFSIVSERVNGGGLDVVADLMTKMVYNRRFPLPAHVMHAAMRVVRWLGGPISRRAHATMPLGYTVVYRKD